MADDVRQADGSMNIEVIPMSNGPDPAMPEPPMAGGCPPVGCPAMMADEQPPERQSLQEAVLETLRQAEKELREDLGRVQKCLKLAEQSADALEIAAQYIKACRGGRSRWDRTHVVEIPLGSF